jgi:hypothetical protein
MPERSSQADATSIDDMHPVYPHTQSITTSSTASAGEQVKEAENKYFCQCLEMGTKSAIFDFFHPKKGTTLLHQARQWQPLHGMLS